MLILLVSDDRHLGTIQTTAPVMIRCEAVGFKKYLSMTSQMVLVAMRRKERRGSACHGLKAECLTMIIVEKEHGDKQEQPAL